jgi:hypothetical protein
MGCNAVQFGRIALLAGYLLGSFIDTEDGGNMFLRSLTEILLDYRHYTIEDSTVHSQTVRIPI